MRIILDVLIFIMLMPALALAQEPQAFTERSKVIATDREIHLYGLPTRGNDGTTNCFDVTITLELGDIKGRPISAAVNSVRCPRVRSSEFVPGIYTGFSAGTAVTCTLALSSFAGRIAVDLRCARDSSPSVQFAATWYTGLIDGHPLEPQLTAAGLDTLPGNEAFAWGRVGTDSNFTWFGCFNAPELFGARQVGDTVTLTNYGADSNFDCEISLFRSIP
jgi:hypothetical protein